MASYNKKVKVWTIYYVCVVSECIRAHLHMYIHGIYISLSVRGVLQEFHHLIINIYEKLGRALLLQYVYSWTSYNVWAQNWH